MNEKYVFSEEDKCKVAWALCNCKEGKHKKNKKFKAHLKEAKILLFSINLKSEAKIREAERKKILNKLTSKNQIKLVQSLIELRYGDKIEIKHALFFLTKIKELLKAQKKREAERKRSFIYM